MVVASAGGLTLFHNGPGDDFSRSPLVGMDECLPTIEPCVWRGRKLPDHGEVWSSAWDVDEEAWQNGALKTSVRLEISPFDFERTIELDETKIQVQLPIEQSKFVIRNISCGPCIRCCGFRRVTARYCRQSTRNLLNGETWVDAIDSGDPGGKLRKACRGPLSEGCGGYS